MIKQALEIRLSQMAESGALEDASPAAMATFYLALVVAESAQKIVGGLKSIEGAIDDQRPA